MLVECVINVSEGRDEELLSALCAVAGSALVDRHTDRDHHRSVLTLVGPPDEVSAAACAVATAAVAGLDLRDHAGAHPRLGVLDVVPFVPYDPGQPPPAELGAVLPLRDRFARWLGAELGVPSFLYGPLPGGRTRTLPDIRREAFRSLSPDHGPARPHPTAGACAVGARPALVAYNVWVAPFAVAQEVAPLVRGPAVRALGLRVGDRAQVSTNLIDPARFGPAALYDRVAGLVAARGGTVEGAELVGLLPESVLAAVPADRWPELDLSADATIEARLGR